MPSPFPGMDPYLEEPDLWRDVHGNLIVAIQGALAAQVAPAYYVAIEEHTYIVSLDAPRALIRPDTAIVRDPASEASSGGLAVATRPSVMPRTVMLPQFEELREPYLELRRTATNEVVTVVELISPTNKSAGKGRDDYAEKRRRLLQTPSSLVEIDLLRAGAPMEMTAQPAEAYRVLVARPWERPAGQLWAVNVRDLLPEVPVPLRGGEPEARSALLRPPRGGAARSTCTEARCTGTRLWQEHHFKC
jgi:hypothetical protein